MPLRRSVVEACRQAVTMMAHVHLGIDEDTAFMVRSWSYDFSGLAAVLPQRQPVQIRIIVALDETVRGKRRVTSTRQYLEVFVESPDSGAAIMVGHMDIDASYVERRVYEALRTRAREGKPVRSCELRQRPTTLSPFDVGRSSQANVVITDPQIGGGVVSASLRAPHDNPSIFDHSQDHVPGMLLMEATRQAAALYDSRHRPTRMLRAAATFHRYVELDAPAVVTGTVSASGRFGFRIIQGGSCATEMSVGFLGTTTESTARNVRAEFLV